MMEDEESNLIEIFGYDVANRFIAYKVGSIESVSQKLELNEILIGLLPETQKNFFMKYVGCVQNPDHVLVFFSNFDYKRLSENMTISQLVSNESSFNMIADFMGAVQKLNEQ